MRKLNIHENGWAAKLPPQAIDLEKGIIGQCMTYESNLEYVRFLKPEHFYRDTHQTIWKSILSLNSANLKTITQHLKQVGELENVGGIFALTELSNQYMNPASMEYSGRIIQQMWIKREIIRISGEAIKNSYDDSFDCIEVLTGLEKDLEKLQMVFDPETATSQILSTKEDEMQEMINYHEGKVKFGLTTGFEKLDNHFRFKEKSLIICNGHDNVGKTAILVFMAVVSNRLHGWKWIIACMENMESAIRKETIQFATGKPIHGLSKEDFHKWHEWSLENFHIIKIRDNLTAPKLMKMARKVMQIHECKGFLIDPYNALDLDKGTDKFFNSHEYHYQVTSQMRAFIKKTGCCIYLNTHAVTEAIRAKHKDGDYVGYPMPPEKADTEGGGKFSNRADDFMTFHRYVAHPTDFNVTHVHVRKIKDTQTGGRPTSKEDPIKLKMIRGHFGFFDENNKNPLVDTGLGAMNPIQRSLKDYSEPQKEDDIPF